MTGDFLLPRGDFLLPREANLAEALGEMQVLVNEVRAERDGYLAQLERYDAHAWEDLLAERDRMRAALVEIRDRHRRHGDRCGACGIHVADRCDACGVLPHPCPDRQTAERALGEKEET